MNSHAVGGPRWASISSGWTRPPFASKLVGRGLALSADELRELVQEQHPGVPEGSRMYLECQAAQRLVALSAVQFERLVQRNRRDVIDSDGAHLVDLVPRPELSLDIRKIPHRDEVVDASRLPGVLKRSTVFRNRLPDLRDGLTEVLDRSRTLIGQCDEAHHANHSVPLQLGASMVSRAVERELGVMRECSRMFLSVGSPAGQGHVWGRCQVAAP
jgi:hypothetical protein